MRANTDCSLRRALGDYQGTQLVKRPFQKQLVGTLALGVLGFSFTKRYFTFPHYHKDDTKPILIDGVLHPFEKQPKSAEGQVVYKKHEKLY